MDRTRRNARSGGFSLVELSITMSLAAGIGGILLLLGQTLVGAFRTSSASGHVESRLGQTLERVTDLLSAAGRDTLSLPAQVPPASASNLEFRRAVGFEAGAVVWSDLERIVLSASPTDPDDGVDNDGDGLVDEQRLVWVERPGGADARVHLLADGIAETVDGAPGLLVTRRDDLLEIRLSMERRVAPGRTLVRSASRTVRLDN